MNILSMLLFSPPVLGAEEGVEGSLYLGNVWQTARVRYDVRPRWSIDAELQAASLLRWQPSIGVSAIWYDGGYQLRGTILGGWLYEDSAVPWNGPSAEARISLYRVRGLVRPWLQLGTKHSFGYLRISTETAEGVLVEEQLQTEWSLTGVMGLSFRVMKGLEVGAGIDFPWVRYPEVSIPGFHLFTVYRGEK